MQATNDFVAHDPHNLSFKTGDIINVLTEDASSWFKGELHGLIGYFPSTFATVLAPPQENPNSEHHLKRKKHHNIDTFIPPTQFLIPQEVSQDMLAQVLKTLALDETVLDSDRVQVIFKKLCSYGTSSKAAAASQILCHIDGLCLALQKRKSEAEKCVTAAQIEAHKSSQKCDELESQIEHLKRKLADANQQLEESRYQIQHNTATVEDGRKLVISTSNMLASIAKEREVVNSCFLEACNVISKLSEKIQARSLEQFDCDAVGCLLEDIGLGQYVAEFVKQDIDGNALAKMKEKHLKRLGVTDLLHRKAIVHVIKLITSAGVIHVPIINNALYWNTEAVVQWLHALPDIGEDVVQKISVHNIPGWALLHLTESDLNSFGLSMGQTMHLISAIESLRDSVFTELSATSPAKKDSQKLQSEPPSLFLCPITCEIMEHPVVAADGYHKLLLCH